MLLVGIAGSPDLLGWALFRGFIGTPAQEPRPVPKPSACDVVKTPFHNKLGFERLPFG